MASEHWQRSDWLINENHVVHVQNSSKITGQKKINPKNVSTLDYEEERSYDQRKNR